jgi:hypothetical protein
LYDCYELSGFITAERVLKRLAIEDGWKMVVWVDLA